MSSIFCGCKRLVSAPNFHRSFFGATPALECYALPIPAEHDDLQVRGGMEAWELLPCKDDGNSDQHEWKRRSKPDVINLRLSASFDLPLPQQSTSVLFTQIMNYHQANSSVARTLLAQLLTHGFIPDRFTFTALIDSYCKDHKYQQAVDAIFIQMKALGIEADDSFFTNLIYTLCARRGPSSIHHFFKNLRANSLYLRFDLYNCLAHEFFGNRNDMKEHKDDEIFACFLEGFFNDYSGDDLSEAVATLRSRMLAYCLPMTNSRVTIFLSCLYRYGLLEDAVMMFKEYKEMATFKLNKVAYGEIMICYSMLGNLDEAIDLLNEMKAQKMDPDFVHYIALLEGCQRLGRLDYIWTMASEMEKVGIDWCSTLGEVGIDWCSTLGEI